MSRATIWAAQMREVQDAMERLERDRPEITVYLRTGFGPEKIEVSVTSDGDLRITCPPEGGTFHPDRDEMLRLARWLIEQCDEPATVTTAP